MFSDALTLGELHFEARGFSPVYPAKEPYHVETKAAKPARADPPMPPPVLLLSRKEQQEEGHITEVTPVVRIAHGIIAQALREQAAQIQLTPQGEKTDVDYWVNGGWLSIMHVSHRELPGLFAAFKALAALPDWEHRMALQGLIAVRYEGTDYDVLIFVTPTRQGETILMRIERLDAPPAQVPQSAPE